jgi:hypothetical protein
MVAAREALYPLLTLVALRVKPIFLLANLSSSKNRVKSFLLYVAMPEKYVLFCANGGEGSLGWLLWPLLIFLPAADLCGTAAPARCGMELQCALDKQVHWWCDSPPKSRDIVKDLRSNILLRHQKVAWSEDLTTEFILLRGSRLQILNAQRNVSLM